TIPANVAQVDGSSRGVRLQIRAQIMDGDRSSGSVELGGSLERGGFDRASGRVDVHRGFVRHLELKHHAARTERKEVMLALGGNGDRARALVEVERQDLVQVMAVPGDEQVRAGACLAGDANLPERCLEPNTAAGLKVEVLFELVAREQRSGGENSGERAKARPGTRFF